MNLKQSFQFQNKLQSLMWSAQSVLNNDDNVTETKAVHLRSKAVNGEEDNLVIETPPSGYAGNVNELADFLLYLMEERVKLSDAIQKAKRSIAFDLDSEVGLNKARQSIASTFRHMASLRNSETLEPGGGIGYRFNAEGNQVPYKCDVRRVTTINFNRDAIRKYAGEVGQRADEVSNLIDLAMVSTDVDYAPPFNVNDTFAEIFETYILCTRQILESYH